jgi:uncharacterized integral membrane protein
MEWIWVYARAEMAIRLFCNLGYRRTYCSSYVDFLLKKEMVVSRKIVFDVIKLVEKKQEKLVCAHEFFCQKTRVQKKLVEFGIGINLYWKKRLQKGAFSISLEWRFLNNGVGEMSKKTIVILVLIVLAIVVVIQNSAMVELQVFFWKIIMSRIIFMVGLLAIGFALGFLFADYRRKWVE